MRTKLNPNKGMTPSSTQTSRH